MQTRRRIRAWRADLERLSLGGDPLRLARADRGRARGGRAAGRLLGAGHRPRRLRRRRHRHAGRGGEAFWRDHKGAGVNAIRTQTLIRAADVVVVRFGDKYRQWNAAFDAGYAAALGKPIVTLHDAELDHALKEVDRAAQATARTAEQVVDVLRYVIAGELPR